MLYKPDDVQKGVLSLARARTNDGAVRTARALVCALHRGETPVNTRAHRGAAAVTRRGNEIYVLSVPHNPPHRPHRGVRSHRDAMVLWVCTHTPQIHKWDVGSLLNTLTLWDT